MIVTMSHWVIAMSFVISTPVLALEQDDENALKETKQLLSQQQKLDEFAKDNPDAKKALGDVKNITGGDPAKMAEVNAISSAVFEEMVRKSNGDSAEIMQKLQEGLKNPQGFMQGLSPEQQARIRSLAKEIDEKNAQRGHDQGPAHAR